MARLKGMVGTWTVEERLEPHVGEPAAVRSGEALVAEGPGGLSLETHYRSYGPGSPGREATGILMEVGLLAWDAASLSYRWAVVGDARGGLAVAEGRWEGNELVFLREVPAGGATFRERHRLVDLKPDGFTWIKEVSLNRGPFQRVATITIRRSKEGLSKRFTP
jgi:hypothetical protein